MYFWLQQESKTLLFLGLSVSYNSANKSLNQWFLAFFYLIASSNL